MRATGSWRAGVLVVFLAAAAVAVGWPDRSPVAPACPAAARPAVLVPGVPRSPIKHIVFVAKENRSFDHYFGAFPDPTGALDQSRTARCWRVGGGVDTFTMQAAPDPMPQDVAHSNGTWRDVYHDGAMDGFCHEGGAIVESTGKDIADTQMKAGAIPNYWAYANKYGIGDKMFASVARRQLRQQRVRRRGPDRSLRHHARTASHPQQPLRRRLGARGSDLGLRQHPRDQGADDRPPGCTFRGLPLLQVQGAAEHHGRRRRLLALLRADIALDPLGHRRDRLDPVRAG